MAQEIPPQAETAKKKGFFARALDLYVDGFRTQSKTSRTLWLLILIKLFIMFAVLKLFFFPNVVKEKGDKQQQTEYVLNQITNESESSQ